MPNPEKQERDINQDDFTIKVDPKEQAKMVDDAVNAAKEAQEKLAKNMKVWRDTREKWDKERLTSLENARKALAADLEGKISTKEFIKQTSQVYGVFGAIWAKMTSIRKTAKITHKIQELDRQIEAQKQALVKESERQNNLKDYEAQKEKENIEEKSIDSKGDLGYHEYTGKGYKFEQARSETLAKSHDELHLTGLKKSVYDRASKDLAQRKDELASKKQVNENILNSLVREGYDLKEISNVYENRQQLVETCGKLERFDAEAKADDARLKEIASEKEAIIDRMKTIGLQMQLQNDDYLTSKKYYDKALELHNKVEAQYKDAMERFEKGDTSVKPQLDILDKQYNKIQKKLREISKKHARYAKPKEHADMNIEGLQSSLTELEEEEYQLNAMKASREKNKLALEAERDNLEKIDRNYQKELGIGYYKAVACCGENVALDNQIQNVELAQTNLERDVLNSDVTTFLMDNEANDNVKGMSINGKVYLDEQEIADKGLEGVKINATNEAQVKEIQKIVRALKSRDVFKHVNGLNLGEYATFNEKTGKFDLYKGSVTDAKGLAKYNLEFQGKYFKDSSVFTEHRIEENPGEFWKEALAGVCVGAAKKIKETLVVGIKSIPKMIPKALSQIPIFGDAFEGLVEQDFVDIANDEKRITETLSTCALTLKRSFDTREKLAQLPLLVQQKLQDPQVKALLEMAMGDAAIMSALQSQVKKKVLTNVFIKGNYQTTAVDIGQSIIAIEKACTLITQSTGDMKKQLKAAKEMLKAGHERFSTIMKQAAAQSKIQQIEGIVDLSTNVIKQTLKSATGSISRVFEMGVGFAGKIAKKISKAVMNHKSKEELLNSPDILGGIDYDKKLISKDDFDKILKSVTGINSRDDLAKALHVVNATDLLRAAKETKGKDKEVMKSMSALGFKHVSKWDKLKVSDILKKTVGKALDAKKTLRNATEKAGFHFGSMFQKIWQTIKGTKAGRSMVNASREEFMIHKQEQTKMNEKGAKQTYIATGAKNLYNMYKKKVEQAQAENKPMEYIKDPKTDRVLDVTKDRQQIIHYFTISGDAAGAAQMVVQGFTKEQQSKLTDKAITDANKAACKEENVPYKEQKAPVKEAEKTVKKDSQAAVMA